MATEFLGTDPLDRSSAPRGLARESGLSCKSLSTTYFRRLISAWCSASFFQTGREGLWAHRAPHARRAFRRCCTRTNPCASFQVSASRHCSFNSSHSYHWQSSHSYLSFHSLHWRRWVTAWVSVLVSLRVSACAFCTCHCLRGLGC